MPIDMLPKIYKNGTMMGPLLCSWLLYLKGIMYAEGILPGLLWHL